MTQSLKLEVKGLYSSFNNLSSVPEGALKQASNVVLDKEGIITSRRGQKVYSNALTDVKQLLSYNDNIYAFYNSQYLAVDNGSGTFSNVENEVIGGDVLMPQATGRNLHYAYANNNIYFTGSDKTWKMDDDEVCRAGLPRAIYGEASTTGSSGFLANNNKVAYRIVWGYKDDNDNLLLGAPSQRIVIDNQDGGSRDGSLTVLLPSCIKVDREFYQIYRSIQTTGTPTDELYLCFESFPTSTEVSNGYVTVTDSTPESLLGATLYTSPSQEGIQNENNPPPVCTDMAWFNNHMFYANTETKHKFYLSIVGVDTDGSNNIGYDDSQTGDTTDTSTTVTDLDTTYLRVGMRVVGTGIPTDTLIASITNSTTIELDTAATATQNNVALEFQDRISIGGEDYYAGSSYSESDNQFYADDTGTVSANIENTALSLIKLINCCSSGYYAFYVSNYDDLPGKMLFETRDYGDQFSVNSSNTTIAWNPQLSNSGAINVSSNDDVQNRVMISKESQPEHVPVYRYLDIGSRNYPIIRVLTLRDAVFVIKDDGIYRVFGDSIDNFSVSLLDSTVSGFKENTIVSFNNQIYAWSNQGIVTISDNGVGVISRPIEQELYTISKYSNFDTSFSVAYESDRKFIFYTVSSSSDNYPTKAYVYHLFTQQWTTWEMDRVAGFINPSDDLLYSAEPTSNKIYQERKDFLRTDYADEEFSVTISSVSNYDITLVDASDVVVGQTIVQGDLEAIIESVDGSVITIDKLYNFQTGSATLYNPIDLTVETLPIDGGNINLLKHWQNTSLIFNDASFTELTLSTVTNLVQYYTDTTVEASFTSGWGLSPWGVTPWGSRVSGQQVKKTLIPLTHSRGNFIQLKITLAEAFQDFELMGVSIDFREMANKLR